MLICFVIGLPITKTDLFKNFAFGIFCSTLVSHLIDIGSTRRQHAKDQKDFIWFTEALRDICSNLPSDLCQAAQDYKGVDDQRRSFDEWSELLFKPASEQRERQKRQIDYFLQSIAGLEIAARDVGMSMHFMVGNPYVDDAFKTHVGKIRVTCKIIGRAGRQGKYEHCCRYMQNDLKNAIIGAFEELTAEYTQKYNDKTYE